MSAFLADRGLSLLELDLGLDFAWERVASSGFSDSGPRQFPSYLFFAFMKTSERCRATWNLRRLIGEPLREINMIIAHDVESGFLGKLPVVFGEHAMHLGDLFTAFCNQVLYSRRYRQPH
jgi:hypothetical protein